MSLSEATMKLLREKFSDKLIKHRKGARDKDLAYIEGHEVIARLNEIQNNDWEFHILDHEIIENVIFVRGRLTIAGVSREQYGVKPISFITKDKFVSVKNEDPVKDKGSKKKRGPKKRVKQHIRIIEDIGSDMKAATTDCLKKCASLFGVALHLYGKDETPVGQVETEEEPIQESEVATVTQINVIKKQLKRLKPEVQDTEGYMKSKYKIGSWGDLLHGDAAKELRELNVYSSQRKKEVN